VVVELMVFTLAVVVSSDIIIIIIIIIISIVSIILFLVSVLWTGCQNNLQWNIVQLSCLHDVSGHCEIRSKLCLCLASTLRTVAVMECLFTTAVDLSRCTRKLDLRLMAECMSHWWLF